MKKRTIKFVVLAMLTVVCLCASTLLVACNNKDSYYLSGSFNNWATYGRGDSIPDGVLLSKGNDDIYSVTVDLEAGDSFTVRKTNSKDTVVSGIFSSVGALTLESDGKISVSKTGKFVLKLDLEDGVLTYVFTSSVEERTVTSVTVTPTSATISLGGTAQLAATVTYSDGTTDGNVSWSSGDTAIATVNASGLVQAVAAGNVTITATAGGKSAFASINVIDGELDPPSEMWWNETSLKLTESEEGLITLSVYPTDADHSFTWEIVSGDNSVASFEQITGGLKVKALKEGSVTIEAKSLRDPSISAGTITITVTELKLKSLTLTPSSLEMEVGETADLQVTVSPAGVSTSLTWSATGDDCITVDQNGHVVATDYGTATVVVKDNGTGISATCAVTVTQHVKSISLSSSSITMYGTGTTRTLTVTFNPSDVANKNFTVSVDKEGVISHQVSGALITITAVAQGSARLTVKSADNEEAVTYCDITVSLSDAEPTLDRDEVVITEIGTVSDAIAVLIDSGEITSFTATANASIVSVTNKTDSTFTLTSSAFGTTTVTVTVTYGSSKTVELTLKVRVVSEFFYLVGPMDGSTEWELQESESAARKANKLLEEVSTGIYEITRDFVVDNEFYIMPAVADSEDWTTTGLTSSYYTAQANGSTYFKYEGKDNIQFIYTGNYTVQLDLTGTTASWTIILNYVAPTSASITADNTTLQVGGTTTANLALTILPSIATVDASNISWSVDAQYSNWLVLSTGSDGTSCVATLSYFEGESEIHVTVTATVEVGNFTVTATRDIVLMPAGASEKPVTSIEFDQATYDFLVDSVGWSITVSAHVNSDATNQGVTYSIVNGANVLYNGISGTYAFSIDADSGVITAKQFGTITVRATAAGDSGVTVDIDILIYSTSFMLAGQYGGSAITDWSSNTTDYTSSSSLSSYTWSDISLYANDVVVILYSTNDWNNGVIRSSGYLNSGSTSGAVGGTTGANGRFTINTTGVYTVTLDLSGTSPSVKFERTGDISGSAEDYSMTVEIHGFGDNYATIYASETGTISPSNEQYTISITHTFTELSGQSWPNIQIVTKKGSVETWYNDENKTTVSTSTASGWQTNGYGQLWFNSDSYTITSYSFTFTFTFDDYGALTKIAITSTAA